jgi:TonB family protein
MLKKRGNAFILPLSQDSRGKVMVGSAIVLFQFILPPPKAPKLKLPKSIRGSWTQRVDWPFASIQIVLMLTGYLILGVYLPTVPLPDPTEFSKVPNRFAKLIAPEPDDLKLPEDKDMAKDSNNKNATQVAKKEEKKLDSNANKPKKARDAATIQKEESIRIAEMQKKVAGKGLLKLIGSAGGGGSGVISDVLGDGGKDRDIDTALAGVKQIGIATSSSQRSRKGDAGATETSKIENLDVKKSKGNLGVKGRKEKAVVARASVGAAEIDGSVDSKSISNIVKRNAGAVKRCYEKGLLANPSLKGKVSVTIMINMMGRVESVDIVANTLGDDSVTRCIKGVVRRWRFPKPDGGPASVTFPFVFSPSN